jgi:hypothetical protein
MFADYLDGTTSAWQGLQQMVRNLRREQFADEF